MKNYLDILDEIRSNAEQAKAAKAEANAHLKRDEIKTAKSIEEFMTIENSITAADKTEAKNATTRAENLQTINGVLQENARASFAAYITPIICEIMQKYNGKQLGEKTKDKIREEAKKHGFSFYFERSYFTRNSDTIHAELLTPEGYTDYRMKDIDIYAKDADGNRTDFISEKNTIQDFSQIKLTYHYTYTENPQEKREALEAAYQAYFNAYEAARKAESELNALLPRGVDHYYLISAAYPHKKF